MMAEIHQLSLELKGKVKYCLGGETRSYSSSWGAIINSKSNVII